MIDNPRQDVMQTQCSADSSQEENLIQKPKLREIKLLEMTVGSKFLNSSLTPFLHLQLRYTPTNI